MNSTRLVFGIKFLTCNPLIELEQVLFCSVAVAVAFVSLHTRIFIIQPFHCRFTHSFTIHILGDQLELFLLHRLRCRRRRSRNRRFSFLSASEPLSSSQPHSTNNRARLKASLSSLPDFHQGPRTTSQPVTRGNFSRVLTPWRQLPTTGYQDKKNRG